MPVKYVTDSMHGAMEHLARTKGEILDVDLENYGDSVGVTLDMDGEARVWVICPGGWFEEVK